MKYVQVSLRNISWTDKGTGENKSCWAYSSGQASKANIFGTESSASLNVRVNGERINNASSDVTLWMNDLTDEEAELYRQAGNDTAYIAIDGDLQNPTSFSVISNAEFAQLQEPSMLFA